MPRYKLQATATVKHKWLLLVASLVNMVNLDVAKTEAYRKLDRCFPDRTARQNVLLHGSKTA